MTRLIRVELLKLRTTRLVYGLLATGTGLSAGTIPVTTGRRAARLRTATATITTKIARPVSTYRLPAMSCRRSR